MSDEEFAGAPPMGEDDEEPQMSGDEGDDAADLGGDGGDDQALPEGVAKEVLTEAADSNWKRPKAGDEVSVHYVGTLQADGSEFDSSRARGEPFKFTLGRGQVIKGWDLGVATMRQGEVAKFTLGPEFAYGEKGSPPKIPANATLVFEVELIGWVSKDDLFQDGGVVKTQIAAGSGWRKPKTGEVVRLTLQVKDKDGAVVEERQALEYALGAEQLGGFSRVVDKALEGMKKGEEVELALGEAYAYGERREGVSVRLALEQIYELKDVSFAKDKSLMKKQVVEGDGYDTPKDGFKAKVRVSQATDGTAPLPGFAAAELEFIVGNGEVCDALEFAVAQMKKGEHAVLTCTTPSACVEAKLGLGEVAAQKVELAVELLEFEKGKDSWDMSEEEKLEFGNARKDVGSELFRRGRIELASERYKKVAEMFSYTDSFKEESNARANALKHTCELNQAACQLKLRDFAAAKASCNKVLKEEPASVKALFRRAQADLELKNFAECRRDLKRVLELDPQNKDARKRLKDAQAGQKEEDIKSKGLFAKMCQGLGKSPATAAAAAAATEAAQAAQEGAAQSAAPAA